MGAHIRLFINGFSSLIFSAIFGVIRLHLLVFTSILLTLIVVIFLFGLILVGLAVLLVSILRWGLFRLIALVSRLHTVELLLLSRLPGQLGLRLVGRYAAAGRDRNTQTGDEDHAAEHVRPRRL